jgi:hypothetical protein
VFSGGTDAPELKANARDLSRRPHSTEGRLRSSIHTGNGQDLYDPAGNAAPAEQHQDLAVDLGIGQALVRNVPVHKDIARVEDFGNRGARHQRLSSMCQSRGNYACDWCNDSAKIELALHFGKVGSQLLDQPVERSELNFGFGSLRLLRDNHFVRLGALALHFHAERDAGR